ncbi:unnamed protein product [Ambrosiozyma monospora]|uniref:Unnamed protein product n=1 Tax=Ambrosiozyma monospora TaxID=43982 RepID=A0ACB5U1D8_AMBMO|nr:unnamed protein product [Ambrosiozyma monospora]
MAFSARKRLAVLASASLINLNCGTLYLFGAYSPQVATTLSYTASQTSRIAICAQSAVVLSGPLVGKLIDKTGYTIATITGTILIWLGYYLFYNQYIQAISNLPYSCLLYVLIGMGSTLLHLAGTKCSMVTFPNMKGLATALPVTCYGASAMVFSTIAKTYFPGDTTKFLYSLVFIPLAISLVCGPLVCLMDKETQSHSHTQTQTPQISKEYEHVYSKIALPLSQSSTPLSESFSDYDPTTSVLQTPNFWCLTLILCICAGLSQIWPTLTSVLSWSPGHRIGC